MNTIGNLVEFLGTVVVNKDMKREHITKSVHRETLGEEGKHGRVVQGEDCDGLAVVDLIGKVSLSEVFIKGREFRVFFKDFGNVKGSGGRNEEGKEEKRKNHRHRWLHCGCGGDG